MVINFIFPVRFYQFVKLGIYSFLICFVFLEIRLFTGIKTYNLSLHCVTLLMIALCLTRSQALTSSTLIALPSIFTANFCVFKCHKMIQLFWKLYSPVKDTSCLQSLHNIEYSNVGNQCNLPFLSNCGSTFTALKFALSSHFLHLPSKVPNISLPVIRCGQPVIARAQILPCSSRLLPAVDPVLPDGYFYQCVIITTTIRAKLHPAPSSIKSLLVVKVND